jgi:hypothetical protein
LVRALSAKQRWFGLSVPVELDQPLVADSEVMRELVQDDAANLAAQAFGIRAVEAHERRTVDRDLVRQDAAVVTATPRERYALIEAEQRLSGGRLFLDDDVDVRDLSAELLRKRIERVLDEPVERVDNVARSQRPSLVRRRMPSLACTARSSSPSRFAAHTNDAPTTTSGTTNSTTMMITASAVMLRF